MNSNGPIFVPHVTRLPQQQTGVTAGTEKKKTKPSDFDAVFDKASSNLGLNKVEQPLKFSAHAMQRLQERGIRLDQSMMTRVRDAVNKAAAKGVNESLVVTPEGAFIVSVENRTVITALDPEKITGSVFTNIDGAVFA